MLALPVNLLALCLSAPLSRACYLRVQPGPQPQPRQNSRSSHTGAARYSPSSVQIVRAGAVGRRREARGTVARGCLRAARVRLACVSATGGAPELHLDQRCSGRGRAAGCSSR